MTAGDSMMLLVTPLVRRMKLVGFRVKFLLVAAVFILPLAVTSGLLVRKLQSELQFIALEQRGADYAAGLAALLSAVQQHRALHSAVLNGNTGLRGDEQSARAEADRRVAAVDELDRRHSVLGLSKDWQGVRERWDALKKELPDDSERASVSAHTALAADITALLSSVGDKSNLTLDPTIETHYLQDELLQRLPALGEAVGEADALALGITARKKIDADERTKLLMLASGAFAAMEAATGGFETAFNKNERLKKSLEQSYTGMSALGPLFTALKQKVLGDTVGIDPASLYGIAAPAEANLQKMSVEVPRQLAALLDERAAALHREQLISLGVSAACLLLAAYLLSGFSVSVRRSLVHARQVAAAIAGGRLDNAIDCDGRDEVAHVLQSLEAMQADLRMRALAIRGATDQIGEVARELAENNQNLARRTEVQAASLEEAASTLSQFTQSVNQTAADADHARQLSSATSELALTGGATVREMVASMEKISGSSKRIREITSLIDSIAFQTNILALNAAVEAARAGEQGRGFAVVASEVRNLAQRTSTAAREIAGLVGQSVHEVDAGSRLVSQAGDQVGRIVTSIQEISGIVSRIAAASAEQTGGIAEVNTMMKKIDGGAMAQHNETLIAHASAAAERLETQAASLSEAVAVFQVGSDPGEAQTIGHDAPGGTAAHPPGLYRQAA